MRNHFNFVWLMTEESNSMVKKSNSKKRNNLMRSNDEHA